MTRRLDILGTSVTLPDPGSATDLAASFRELSGHLTDLEDTLQALTRPDAWEEWTGPAASAFGQSIGQLPAEIGDVRDAYDDVASALRRYATELEPVVNTLTSLSFRAEEAEGTLAAVRTARSQAIARGQDPVTTGWDVRLADATAAVSALRGQLSRLLGELTALAATCTKQITAAEPARAGKSLFGSLASDFVRDVADPLGHAAEDAGKFAADAVKVEVVGAAAMFEALWIHPVTDLVHDATKHLDAEKLGSILGDVAGVLGIVALLPIPGVDVVAGLAALALGGAAAAADWWAAAHHEDGASYLQAGLTTVTLGLGGVGMVAKAGAAGAEAADAADAAAELDDGADAAKSGQNLWVTGLKQTFTPSGIKDAISDDKPPDGASTGLRGFGSGLYNKALKTAGEAFTFPSGAASSSPAVVTITRVGWTASRLNDVTTTVQDIEGQKAESGVP